MMAALLHEPGMLGKHRPAANKLRRGGWIAVDLAAEQRPTVATLSELRTAAVLFPAAVSGQSLALMTCSMAADRDLFALLAASVDHHVDPRIRHDVVVPGADLAEFRVFETAQRRIIAQEDVLPVRLRRLPRALKLLAPIRPLFRRPLYMTPKGQLVRGWMLQQCLKIEMSRTCPDAAIMHVDSDVCFFRALSPQDVFDGERTHFFRAIGETKNPKHIPWLKAAAEFLGMSAPEDYKAHYIENCVLWNTGVARDMAARVETIHGRPIHDVIFAAETMSEYYLYGLYADFFPAGAALRAEDVSFCNSYWPADETEPVDFETLRHTLHPKHCAMAIQSTHRLTLAERRALYERAERDLA